MEYVERGSGSERYFMALPKGLNQNGKTIR